MLESKDFAAKVPPDAFTVLCRSQGACFVLPMGKLVPKRAYYGLGKVVKWYITNDLKYQNNETKLRNINLFKKCKELRLCFHGKPHLAHYLSIGDYSGMVNRRGKYRRKALLLCLQK